MRQRELVSFVKKNLPAELLLVQAGGYTTALPQLNAFEKAVLYAYTTDDHYGPLNQALYNSAGTNILPLGQAIVTVLRKLERHVGTVHRAAFLSAAQLRAYSRLAALGSTVTWPAFMSTSKSKKVATDWVDGTTKNCLFLIETRKGKCIEDISYYGPNTPDPALAGNEEEVLFVPNTTFSVLAVTYVPALAGSGATAYYEVVLGEI